jgi:hypothetical protein
MCLELNWWSAGPGQSWAVGRDLENSAAAVLNLPSAAYVSEGK